MKHLAVIGVCTLALAAAHAEAPPPERLTGSVVYTQVPTGQDFARHYPARALSEKQEGRVVLDCIVQADQSLKCAIATEDPVGYGFGSATMSLSGVFRIAAMHEGAPTAGKRVALPIWWRLA